MSKPLSYHFSGTKGDIVHIADSLPSTGQQLLKEGWNDISHPKEAENGHFTYQEPTTGLKVRYDEPKTGASGFGGQPHFHILNPNATGPRDKYLDKNGNPVKKNSKASHILPKGKKKNDK